MCINSSASLTCSLGVHVLMSKDWGGRQVNPGVSFLRTSREGKQFLDRWEAEITTANHHDDLLAIRDGIEKKRLPVSWKQKKQILMLAL